MGLFDKLFGRGTSGNSEICPTCGAPLHGDDYDDNRFECSKCHHVAFRVNGEIVDAFSPKRFNNNPGTCESCQQSLAGGDRSLPWEDGDNANAYIRCPHCSHKNIKYGFGEDD
jgi:DNA-directed RNA polymerase subunit RPC12/RpoP